MRKVLMWSIGTMIVSLLASPSLADDLSDMKTQMDQLRSRIDKQEKIINEFQADSDSAEAIRADAETRSPMPEWMDALKFYGDFRLRYQGECFSGRNKKNRNRSRFRLRFGFKKTWLDDQMEVGFRLASGSSNDPTSTNQTLEGNFSEKHIWIDLAYAKYSPDWFKGLTIIGGKMKKPFVHTDLVWDGDVNPDGLWAQYKRKFGTFEPFAGAGYFTLDESSGGHDTILMSYQVGFNWKLTDDIKWTFAGTYYDYDHYDTGYAKANGNNAVGGVLAAQQFKLINITNILAFHAFNLPMKTYFDFVHNCGDEDRTNGYRGQDSGFAFGFKAGKNKKKGDWSAGYKYAYIEANATAGAFNDSDFGHTNRQGHTLGAKYNLTDSLTIGGKILYTEPITGTSENQHDTTLQFDLVWKF